MKIQTFLKISVVALSLLTQTSLSASKEIKIEKLTNLPITIVIGKFEKTDISFDDPRNKFVATETLNFEEYLKGVVYKEVWLEKGWGINSPLEALKAQAVAARTYAKCHMGKHKGKGYDVCNTVHCQVWAPAPSGGYDQKIIDAVNDTAGLGVTYDGSIIDSTFFSSTKYFAGHMWYTKNSEIAPGFGGNYAHHLRKTISPEGAVGAGGHGAGLSQYGAKVLAGSGTSYQDILKHYYGPLPPYVKKVTATQGNKTKYNSYWEDKNNDPYKEIPKRGSITSSSPFGTSTIKITIEYSEEMTDDEAGKLLELYVSDEEGKVNVKVPINLDSTKRKASGELTDKMIKENKMDGTYTLRLVGYHKYAKDWQLDSNPETFCYQKHNADKLMNYDPGTDTNHKIYLDTNPPKIVEVRIIQGKKQVDTQGIITIVDTKVVYKILYENGIPKTILVNNPIIGGDELFFIAIFDKTLDITKPLKLSFKSLEHTISSLFFTTTNLKNDTFYGEFVIPRNSEYQGTHTLSISNAFDEAGNEFDSDPTTEQIDPDTSNQFYVFLPDIAYTQWVPVPDSTHKQGSTHLLNIESKESIMLTGGWAPQFFPDGEWLAIWGKDTYTATSVDIWKMRIDGTCLQNLTNSPKSEENFLIAKDGKKIIFARQERFRNNDIWRLELEGGTQTNLTNTEGISENMYDISQDKILYSSHRDLYIMDIDGNNKRMLVSGKDEKGVDISIDNVRFSPDGSKIFYSREVFTYIYDSEHNEWKIDSYNTEIYSINENGSDNRRITDTPEEDELVDDINDTKLLYTVRTWGKIKIKDKDLYISNLYMGEIRNLTPNTPDSFERCGKFLPDGRIVFMSDNGKARENDDLYINYDIYIINPDGTNLRRLTTTDPYYNNEYSSFRPIGTQTYGSLRGKVSSGTTGISGAMIELIKDEITIRSAMTDKDGNFIIENVKVGDYEIKAKAPYYEIETKTAKIEKERETYIEFILTAIGNLSVKVGSETGTIEGAIVSVIKDGMVIGKGMTDKDGMFRIENIKVGTYKVKVEITGYSIEIWELTIEKGKEIFVEFILTAIGETGGKVVVVKDDGIWQENADGSNPRKLWEDGSITDVCLSEDGNKILYCSNKEGNYDIYLLDIPSLMLTIFHSPEDEISARFAPDERILFVRAGYDSKYIWIMDMDGSNETMITQGEYPAISPDGNSIIFSKPGSDYEVFIMNKDGTNIMQLTNNEVDDIEPSFSPDGEKIAYNSGGNIYTMNKDGGNQTKVITNGTNPSFSPDGNSLAFIFKNTLYTTNLQTGELKEIGQGIKAISWSCGSVENKPPVPIITGTLTGYEGEPITLDGSSSYDPDGTI
ncbi:MAG: SpoIID/LytB domain-containing protein, partial [bacterium]